jgi:hypothetical protein
MSAEESRTRLKQTGRNDPCPCGSGKKYKKCHRSEDEAAVSADLQRQQAEAQQAAEQEEAEGESSRGHGVKTGAGQKRPKGQGGQGGARSQDQGQRTANLPRRGAV